MRDIDFEELDKAVNNYLVGGGSSKKANETMSRDTVGKSASEFHQSGSPALRRSGRFMDIMPASSQAHEEKSKTSEVKKPVKYTAKAKKTIGLLDDFREVQKTTERHTDRKHIMQDTLSSDESIELPEPEFSEPVLEDISIDIDKIEPLAPVDIEQDIPSSVSEDDAKEHEVSNIEVSEKEPFVEPILESIEPEEEIVDELILPSDPGVFQIDDEELTIFDKKTPEVVKPLEVKEPKPEQPVESPIMLESKEPKRITPNAIEDSSMTTPFLPNARVEKRPLGASAGQTDELKSESKLISSNQKIAKDDFKDKAPLLSSEEYATPIKYKKKKSGLIVVFVIILLIALGAGGGALAYYLMMM